MKNHQSRFCISRKSPLLIIVMVSLFVNFLMTPENVEAQFERLIQRIPRSANSIVVIDAKGVMKSPLAIKENWKKNFEMNYAKNPIMIPPEADKIIIASNLDRSNNFKQDWELAVMSMTEPISMQSIARAEGGYVDSINYLKAAWTPSDAYFVGLEPKMLGVMAPANRQAVSRWAEFAIRKDIKSEVSAYLEKAVKSVKQGGPQIVLALDLKDVVKPHSLRGKLDESDALKKKKKIINSLIPILMGIQGIKLEVRFLTSATGTLTIDFDRDTKPFSTFAKPLILEAMDNFGAHLDDIHQWRVTLTGKSIVMKGKLSESSLRRIFSLLEIPSVKFSELKDEISSPGSPDIMQKASLSYFKSVTVLVDDLRKSTKAARSHSAAWTERYGRKIDRLPILNVDEELLNYGSMVGETFRSMGLARRGAGVRSGVRNSQLYGAYQYNYNNNGYYSGRRLTEESMNANRKAEHAKSQKVRFESWKDIEDSTAKIRRVMTKKYQIEF